MQSWKLCEALNFSSYSGEQAISLMTLDSCAAQLATFAFGRRSVTFKEFQFSVSSPLPPQAF
jgi:hypothetical protein